MNGLLMATCSELYSEWPPLVRVHAYADKGCTLEVSDDIFAGQWGPQTNSPFNAGCSETQWSEKCVQFGRNYYKWEACTSGCTPPLKK